MSGMARSLRAVLVGCGAISETWLREIRRMAAVSLVGLVDLDEAAAAARRQEFGCTDATIGSDLAAVLDRVRPDIVFDCSVPSAHLGVTLTALQRGCHVLGEKPLADSMTSAHRMVAAAEQASRVYAVMQNRRYMSSIRRLAAFLASGGIGRITTINSDFYIGAHFGDFRDRMAHVLLLDMAIHTFDAARLIANADPVSVFCQEWNPAGSWYDRDASAAAIFNLTGGIVYTYRGSWCAEGLSTQWEAEWHIIGTGGSVRWDGEDGFAAQVVHETGGFQSEFRDVELPPYSDLTKTGGHGGVIREFVRCVQNGTLPETVCTDNIHSLAMVFGAIESAERRLPVNVGGAA